MKLNYKCLACGSDDWTFKRIIEDPYKPRKIYECKNCKHITGINLKENDNE